MIVWNRANGRFEVDGRPDFTPGTRTDVIEFQKRIALRWPFSLLGYASPQDQIVATAPVGPGGTPPGKNLDHHISIDAIQHLVCDYLNGDVSVWVFLNFVGQVVTPSWLSLADSAMGLRGRVIREFLFVNVQRLLLVASKHFYNAPRAQQADIATRLCRLLNSAQQNLRFGDETTNLSIHNALDARAARGLRFEPVALVEIVWAYASGISMLSPESSAFLYSDYGTLGHRAMVALRGNAEVAASESSSPVGWTQTGNAVMGLPNHRPSPLRGNPFGLAYFPVGKDTLLNLFAVYLVYYVITSYLM
jgi:hypothetical protein